MTIDYSEKIPNNVDLAGDSTLQRALEHWQPTSSTWWSEMGPDGFAGDDVYLRTAVSVDADGWAHFDYVKMPDYRWGIFLAAAEPDRTIGFGDAHGRARVAGGAGRVPQRPAPASSSRRATPSPRRSSSSACSATPRRRSTTCATCSRSTSRRAATCGRWSTCCTRYFGRDGREEAEELLERRSGDADKPRILGAFNEPHARLARVLHVHDVHRPRRQVPAAARSPSRASIRSRARRRFMLTEEAHHMFVGETGVGAHRPAHLRADEAARDRRSGEAARRGRHRPADDPALPQLLVLACRSTSSAARCRRTRRRSSAPGLKGRFEEGKRGRRPSAARRGVSGARASRDGATRRAARRPRSTR